MEQPELIVDVDRILQTRMHRRPPRLLAWFLKKLIHQDWLNEAMNRCRHLRNEAWMSQILRELRVKVEVSGIDKLAAAAQMPCLFVSNHPLGGVDVLALVDTMRPFCPQGLRIPANDLLSHLSPISEMLVPVSKLGCQSHQLSQLLNEIYASSAQILTFPCGKVSRLRHGVVSDDAWKKNFVISAAKYHRQVVPMRVDGCNSKLFYYVSRIREFLRIKVAWEMLLLPHELYLQQGKTLRIVVGDVVPWQQFDDTRKPLEWAQYVKNIVYQLK